MLATLLFLGSCAPASAPTPPLASRADGPSVSPAAGLAAQVDVVALSLDRRWYTVPDQISSEPAIASVEFGADASAGAPRLRLDPGGRDLPLEPDALPRRWSARIDLAGMAPGVYRVGVTERIGGAYTQVGAISAELRLSQPEYAVWTLDFEGDAAGDPELANTAAIADTLKIPMTIMWNPRAWTTSQVTPARAEAMAAWTKARAASGDEISLHLHMWTDFVRASGLVARTAPNWAGRSDGYDVPMTAFSEAESRTLIEFALKLMAEHGMQRPTTFRAGGQFANAANLRALAAWGFVADASAVPAGGFGRLPLPWTLAADAQPYHPAAEDANIAGSLQVLEAPTIGGNTYAFTKATIRPMIDADLSYLAPPSTVATQRRAITIVSHPGTIVASERAAIETLFAAFEPLRYDRGNGPLRFITLAQLATAYSR